MNIKNLLLATTAILLAACSTDSESPAPQVPEQIRVTASVGAMTRTATDGVTTTFEPGDRISVYAWTGSADAVPSALVVDNSVNTFDGSAWTADPQMLWADMSSAHYFLGIYPERDVTDFTADGYTLDVADQEASDLLVAVQTGTDGAGLKAVSNPVPLTFDHVMAKLIVNLNFRDQWGETPEVTAVKAVLAAASATVDYLSKTLTGTDRQEIALPGSTPADGYALGYASVMIPQTGFNTISVSIAGQNYTYTHPTDIPLVRGEYTTVNLIVGRDRIELGSVTVNDWKEGETIDGGEAVD